MHGIHQGVNHGHGDVIPFFMQGMCELAMISGGILTSPYPPIKFVPQMFNWGQIWTECWPIEWVYVTVGKKLLANSGDMGPGIVLLQYQVPCLHAWDGNWAEDFVSLPVLHILCTRRLFFVLVYSNIITMS
jgi:hypothetical protein